MAEIDALYLRNKKSSNLQRLESWADQQIQMQAVEEAGAEPQTAKPLEAGKEKGGVLSEIEKAIVAPPEIAASIATGLIAWPLSKLGGIAKTITSGAEAGRKTEEQIAQFFTYMPKGETAQQAIQIVGAVMELGVWPAKKVAEVAENIGLVTPEGRYYLETAGELATFAVIPKIKARAEKIAGVSPVQPVGPKELKVKPGETKLESTGDLFAEQKIAEGAVLGDIRPEFLKWAEGTLKEGQEVSYQGKAAKIEAVQTVATPQGEKPQILTLDVEGKKIKTSANDVTMEPPKPPIVEPGFEEFARGFDEIAQDVKTVLSIGERGEFSWRKKGETPKPGDFVSFTDETGKTQQGKIRDVDEKAGTAEVFTEEAKRIDPNRASVEVSLEKIVQEKADKVLSKRSILGERGAISTEPLSEAHIQARKEAIDRLKRDAGKLGSTIGEYLKARGIDAESIKAVLAELPPEDREKKFGPYKERLVTVTEGTKAAMDEFLKMADEDQIIEGAPGPQGKPKVGFNYGVNFDRINTPDDVKAVISKIAVLYKDKVKEYRRDVRTHAQTENAAMKLGMTVEQLLAREKGEAFNPEESLAARGLAVASAMKLKELANHYLTTGKADSVRNDLLKQFAINVEIQAQTAGVRAEAGRTLNQWAIDATGEIQFLNQVGEAVERIGTGMDMDQLARAINILKTPSEFSKMAEELAKPGAKDLLTWAWYQALLSGFKTHAANILGNSLTVGMTVGERGIAGNLPWRHPEGVVSGESSAMMGAMVRNFTDSLRMAGRVFKAKTPEEVEKIAGPIKIETRKVAINAEAFGLDPDTVIGRAADFLINVAPTKALVAEDAFFKNMAYRGEMAALALREAKHAGLERKSLAERVTAILSDPSDAIIERARDFSNYVTFTRELGQMGKAFVQFSNSHPLAKIILPFVSTPSNIAKFSFERMPGLNLALSEFRNDLASAGAGRDLAIAKMATGTMLLLTGISLAAGGVLTGGGPQDTKLKRAAQQEKGWQPYSVKIGDEYYSYNRLDPLGMWLGTAADMVQMAQDAPGEDLETLGWAGIVGFMRNLTSKTYLQGIANFLEFLEKPTTNFKQFYRGIVGSIVPAIVAQANQQIDPVIREINSISDQIKSRIPGLSETLPPKRNLWGEPVRRWGALGPDIVSPIAFSKEKVDPVADEILTTRVSISMPPKSLGGIQPSEDPLKPERATWGIKLTPEQYDRLSVLRGKEVEIGGKNLHEYLADLINSELYRRGSPGPDGLKARMIQLTVTNFEKLAEERLKEEIPELREQVQQKRIERRQMLIPGFQ